MKELLQQVLNLIERDREPDFERCEDVYSYSGGNYDDAYDMGIDGGRAELANEIYDLISPVVNAL